MAGMISDFRTHSQDGGDEAEVETRESRPPLMRSLDGEGAGRRRQLADAPEAESHADDSHGQAELPSQGACWNLRSD